MKFIGLFILMFFTFGCSLAPEVVAIAQRPESPKNPPKRPNENQVQVRDKTQLVQQIHHLPKYTQMHPKQSTERRLKHPFQRKCRRPIVQRSHLKLLT